MKTANGHLAWGATESHLGAETWAIARPVPAATIHLQERLRNG
ncbi:MAG: hypothetical protein ACAF42_18005 [Limnothrix sp. BL-A-16]